MNLQQLTFRTYLGKGNVHYLKKNDTEEIIIVPCTDEQYAKLGAVDGWKDNPKLANYTWLYSVGGTYKVDTPTTLLAQNEYTVLPDGNIVVCVNGLPEQVIHPSKVSIVISGKKTSAIVDTDLPELNPLTKP